jgi:hypothetical protein
VTARTALLALQVIRRNSTAKSPQKSQSLVFGFSLRQVAGK